MNNANYYATLNNGIASLFHIMNSGHVAGVLETPEGVDIIVDNQRKFHFYIHPHVEEVDVKCVEYIRGYYDRSGEGEPTLHGIFEATIPNDGVVEIKELNLSYCGKEECQHWLRVIDREWDGVIARKIAEEIAKLQTIWAET